MRLIEKETYSLHYELYFLKTPHCFKCSNKEGPFEISEQKSISCFPQCSKISFDQYFKLKYEDLEKDNLGCVSLKEF